MAPKASAALGLFTGAKNLTRKAFIAPPFGFFWLFEFRDDLLSEL
ncbi:MAG: hypothetical protein V4699_00160 [Patescibacteria group bacterium]